MKYHRACFFQWTCEMYRVAIKGSWFMNHESNAWSHKPKISKISIFHQLFFPNYDNFKLISTDGICLSISLELNEWGWMMKEQNFVNSVVKH